MLFPESGNHYTWRQVTSVVHNFILGKLWIDNHGEMVVTNHNTGDECRVKFEPFSYFGGTPKKVAGRVVGKKGKVEYVVEGTWDAKVRCDAIK